METGEILRKKLDSLIDLNLKDKTKGDNWFRSSVEYYLKTGKIDSSLRDAIKYIANGFAKEVINNIPILTTSNCPNCGYNPQTYKEDLTPKEHA